MSNTVGSQEMIPRVLHARKNLVLKLTEGEFDILIGSVLGDGYITKLGRIQIEQGDKQRKYLEWKYEMLKRIATTRILQAKRQKPGEKATISYRFWTKQYFCLWRHIFYPEGKKIIPRTIESAFSP